MKSTLRWGLSIAAAMLTTHAALAQVVPSGRNVNSAPLDIAVTYDALHTNYITPQNFWMQGGAVELGAQFYRGLGVTARIEGLHAGANSTTGAQVNMVTTVFGPRYTFRTRSGKYAVFGEGLAGMVSGFNSLFPERSVIYTSANALALDIGGGVDVRLSHSFAIRVIRAGYLRTQLPNSTTNVQNNLSLGIGLVLRF